MELGNIYIIGSIIVGGIGTILLLASIISNILNELNSTIDDHEMDRSISDEEILAGG